VQQPIAMTFDDRGRLWVVECYSYRDWRKSNNTDRVLIFEDKDGDGAFDTRTVFLDNGHNLTGIALRETACTSAGRSSAARRSDAKAAAEP
jgi:glucose/arabinose dehydrogenase